MNVYEIFSSTQGEGSWAGQFTTFVRFGGCNVCCSWCDEPNAIPIKRPTSESIGAEDLVGKILHEKTTHVCFTGGEPLIQDSVELFETFKLLLARKKILSVESNATRFMHDLPFYMGMITLSPKLSSSGNVTPVKQLLTNVKKYIDLIGRPGTGQIQLKFVIGSYQDCFDLKQYISAFPKTLFYVQSEWIENGAIFEPRYTMADMQKMFTKADIDFANMNLRFGVQLHKFFNVK
jgi:organic radical activating enzyme